MKKYPYLFILLLSFLFTAACTQDDEMDFNKKVDNLTKTVDINKNYKIVNGMQINCTNYLSPIHNYSANFTWSDGIPPTVPFSSFSSYIEIEPTSLSITFPIVSVPVSFFSSNSTMDIEHANLNSLGSVSYNNDLILIHAKTFNYRYVHYDNLSSNYQATNWKFHDIISN